MQEATGSMLQSFTHCQEKQIQSGIYTAGGRQVNTYCGAVHTDALGSVNMAYIGII